MIRPYGGAVPYTLAVILIRQQNSLSKTNYIEGKKFKIPEMETKLLLFPIHCPEGDLVKQSSWCVQLNSLWKVNITVLH